MATPLTDTQVNTLGSQGYTEGSNVPGRGTLLPDGTFQQSTTMTAPSLTGDALTAALKKINPTGTIAAQQTTTQNQNDTYNAQTGVYTPGYAPTTTATGTTQEQIPAGWDAQTYANFKTANPGLEPDAEETQIMLAAGNKTPEAAVKTADQLELEQISKDRLAKAKEVSDAITNIQNGTTPLSAGEQAQINGLKQQFQQMINEQKLTNIGATGIANVRGYQTGAAEYDPTFQIKTIGSIITAGQNKITDLQIKEASAVAALTLSLKEGDVRMIKAAYDTLNNAQKERQELIQKTIDEAKTKMEKMQAAQQKVTDSIEEIATNAAKNGADAATVNKILASRSLGEAISNAGESLQTATGIVGEYKFYQKDALSKGLVPVDFNTYQNMDANRKKSIVAAGVAGTTSTGIPLKNLTESQAKDYTYARRGSNAMPIIDSLETTITSMNPLSYKTQISLESSVLGRNYASSEIKQIRQAERDFLTAVLRRESGASISPSEFAEGERVYFPIPGDDEKTLQQKKNSRETAIATFKSNVPQYQDRFANEPSNQLINIEQQADQTLTTSLNTLKTTNPDLYKIVSSKYLEIDPQTGNPYTAQEILEAFNL